MKKIFLLIFIIFVILFYLTDYKFIINDSKYNFLEKNSLKEHLKIYNISLGKQVLNFTINGEKKESIMLNDLLNIRCNIDKTVENINFLFVRIRSTLFLPTGLSLILNYNKELLDQNIDKLCEKFEVKYRKAELKKEKNFSRFLPELKGISIDRNSLKQSILNAIDNGEDEVEISLITGENDNVDSKLNVLISSFETKFNYSDKNRVTNLEVASNILNNLYIRPGQTFSFNDFVGERTYKKGYKDAGVIVNGQIVPGIAGGICQVTSTLYNALLLAGIKIEKRYPHSIYDPTWAYTNPGFDSAVAYPYKDLIFTNNLNQPIIIKMKPVSGILKASIFGSSNIDYKVTLVSGNPYYIKFSSSTTWTDKLNKGTTKVKVPGVNGCIVDSYRIYQFKDGNMKKEFLFKDKYRKVDEKILTGR